MNKPNQDITWRQLKKMNISEAAPFQLSLADSPHILYCEEVIRVIPGKRMVVFGQWENKLVVAKLFFQSGKAKKNVEQDAQGVQALLSARIPTPNLLFQSPAADKHIQVLIFEKITQAKNLETLWQEKRSIDEMLPLLRHVIIELATQHVLGIVQKDLHLKNFLITNKTIFTLDGGSIEQTHQILSKPRSLDHLALFFAQLGIGCEALQAELFDCYASSRSWIVKEADKENLKYLVDKWLALRWKRYQLKIFRNCSAFQKIKNTKRLVMYDRAYETNELIQLLNHPEGFFSLPDVQLLKNGRSATVAKLTINNRTLVVKRYNIKNTWHWLRRCLRPTRALAQWRLAHKLLFMNVSTAKPVAFIENYTAGLRSTSYYIMEYVDGPHLGGYFATHRTDDLRNRHMADQVMLLLKNLLSLYMTHGDLKMTNILVEHDKPVLIDLDGMIEHRSFYGLQRAWTKEVKRFMQNWVDFPSVRALFEKLEKI